MRIFRILTSIALIATMANACHAQGLFGQRELGGSLSRRSVAGSRAASGAEPGGQRFLRGERTVADFVGGAAAGFVGRQSATTAATTSVSGLTEEVRPPINRRRVIRQGELYAERLRLVSDSQPQISVEQKPRALSQSLRTLIQSRSLTIEVSQEGHSAILRGAVPSEHDRQTIALLVMFEPGIQKVENELTVDSTLPPFQHRPRDRKSN